MQKIVILGASGFIGRELVRQACAAGHEVNAPDRATWRLGMPLPIWCQGADTVIHLASATLVASADREGAMALDLQGSRILIEQCRTWRLSDTKVRFIFVSSQSAWAGARNDYGRSKFAIEMLLDEADEVIVRPGLVYAPAGGSVFGVFEKLASLPVLPVLGSTRCIQPIAVDELATCLLRIAALETPARAYNLGAEPALSFAETVRAVANRTGRRVPFNLRLPAGPVRWAAGLADRLLRLSPSLLERIDGLIALQPMQTAASLAALGISLAPFDSARG